MREHGLRSVPAGARSQTRADPHGLTPREREVLELVRADLTNEQIAQQLVISARPSTTTCRPYWRSSA